jgi:hypothetical protein
MVTDPYHDNKPIHRAKLISEQGEVSPLCATRPRKLNFKVETWTLLDKFVTCPKCLAKLPKKLPM